MSQNSCIQKRKTAKSYTQRQVKTVELQYSKQTTNPTFLPRKTASVDVTKGLDIVEACTVFVIEVTS